MTGTEQSTIYDIAERDGASAVLAALAAWCSKAARDCDNCNDTESAKEYRADGRSINTLAAKLKATHN